MSLLIDPPRWPARGRLWSHLISDTSFEELHAFAASIGLDRRLFEGDHYDVPEEHYDEVLAAGAQCVPTRELVRRLRRAGLRRPKRRGEKVLPGRYVGGVRVDTVLSTLPPPGPVHAWNLLVRRGSEVLLVSGQDGPGGLRGSSPSGAAAGWPGLPDGVPRRIARLRWVDRTGAIRRTEMVLLAVLPAADGAGPLPASSAWVPLREAAGTAWPPLAPVLDHLARRPDRPGSVG